MENQRIRLSKAMLKEGLLKLLEEKPLSQISIYEICQRSQINRTTFYKYYGSQSDLLKEIEKDFLDQLDEDLKAVLEKSPGGLSLLLNHLYEKRESFVVLARTIPAREFSADLFAVPNVQRIFQNKLDTGAYSETQARYIRQFVLQGIFAVLYEWLSSENPEPVSEIEKTLGLLISNLGLA